MESYKQTNKEEYQINKKYNLKTTTEIQMSSNMKDVMLTPQQQMVSGTAGAVAVSLLMTPLDVVKTRLQAQERFYLKNHHLYNCSISEKRPKYLGTADAFIKITKTEGISSLWSGLSSTLALAVPMTVIYFTTFEHVKLAIQTHRKESLSDTPVWVSLCSGATARFVAATILSPIEMTKTKMQAEKMPWSDVHKCLRVLIASQGVRGLWNGCTATLLRDVPFSALYWPLYQQARDMLTMNESMISSMGVNFISGALAGTAASFITMPFDVIKTIKQVERGQVKTGQLRNNLTIAKDLIREKGVPGLYSGVVPRLLKVGPACAVIISSYEFCKEFFRQQNIDRVKDQHL